MAAYVFIHGLGQDASAWDETLSRLKGDAAAAACPGLFALPKGGALTYENLYAAFADYCEGLPGPLHLCGLSLGAVLALQYAAARPEKAASLVLIGAQYKMPGMMLRLQNVVFRFMPAQAFEAMGLGKRDLLGLTKSMLQLDLSGALPAVRCKTLVVCGEKDKANRKAAAELARRLPQATFCPVAGAGHEVNVDAPQQLAAVLQAFYQGEN